MKLKVFELLVIGLVLVTSSVVFAEPIPRWMSGAIGLETELPQVRSGDQRNVDLIWADDRFLMLWDHDVNSDTEADIHAIELDKRGQPLGETIIVSAASCNQKRPAVARIGGRNFVAWEDCRNGSGGGFFNNDLFATFIEADGTLSALNGFAIAETELSESDVEVAASSEALCVVWERVDTRVFPRVPHVVAQRFDADGTPIDSEPLYIGEGAEPTVVSADGRFLIIYQTPTQRIGAQFISGDVTASAAIGTPFDLVPELPGRSDEPSIAWSGSEFAVTWIIETSENSIETLAGQRFDVDAMPLEEADVPLRLYSIGQESDQEVIWDGSQFVIVGNLVRTFDEIGGVSVIEVDWDLGSFEQTSTSLRLAANLSQDPAIAVADDGSLLVAWEDELWETSKFDGENIFTVSREVGGEFTTPALLDAGVGPGGGFFDSAVTNVGDDTYVVRARHSSASRNTANEIFLTHLDRAAGWSQTSKVVGTTEVTGMWALKDAEGSKFFWWDASNSDLEVFSIDPVAAASEIISAPLQRKIAERAPRSVSYGRVLELGSDDQTIVACWVSNFDFEEPNLFYYSVRADVVSGDISLAETNTVIVPFDDTPLAVLGVSGDGGNFLVTYADITNASVVPMVGSLRVQRFRVEGDSVVRVGNSVVIWSSLDITIGGQHAIVPREIGAEIVFVAGGEIRRAWIPWDPAQLELVVSTGIGSAGEEVLSTAPVVFADLGGHTTVLYRARGELRAETRTRSWAETSPTLPTPAENFGSATDLRFDGLARTEGGEIVLASPIELRLWGRSKPSIERFELANGLVEFDFSGPAFGLMNLNSSTDLRTWQQLGESVRLDEFGRGSASGDAVADVRRFWRGIYVAD